MKKTAVWGLAFLAITYTSCKDKSTETQMYLSASDNDTTVKPGDDFYMYANGSWIKTAVIPETESSAGGFTDLYLKTQKNLENILKDLAAKDQASGSIEQKVADFYAAGMDSVTIDKRGYEPIKPLLSKIDAIKTSDDILNFVVEEQKANQNVLITLGAGADEKNSVKNILNLYQGGLGLPDREYYFKTDAETQNVVNAYKKFVTELFKLIGTDTANAVKHMNANFEVEKQMAASHRTNVELRDPQSNYNKTAVADLDKQQPNIKWSWLLTNLGIKTDSVNVAQPGYYNKLNAMIKSVPVDSWKSYLKAHVLENYAGALSSAFVNARFEYNKTLTGQKKMKPLSERMVQATDYMLGEALGQIYVKKYFTADAKKRMDELVSNLQTAFSARIDKLDWMTDSTKQKAKEKMGTFLKKIGYPDKWRDYSKVNVSRSTYFENIVAAQKALYDYSINKVGKPVDKAEWGMTPPTINAYYNPTFNEIVFPAGILQFPFFDLAADDAINYGGIGMVIGHEMTHGFDDQGAQYDKNGNMQNWWTKEDNEKFKAKGEAVVNLYNSFTVLDSLHVNGKLTLGENIADIGGLAIAYDAFKLTDQGKKNEVKDGLTADQRFFLSFAQIWKSKLKDESARYYINVDPHSPDKHRVNGPLMNFTPFYNAYNVKPGDKMYKPENERIKIW
jgi:putative endopeptidase